MTNRALYLLTILIVTIISKLAFSAELLDEFSAIYHSDVIIEVGVSLDKYGHPKKSCMLRKIRGESEEVKEVLKKFSICEKRGSKVDQKRFLMFYKNGKGRLRSMDMIRQGVGPYSDASTYKPYLRMVKMLNDRFEKNRIDAEGILVIDDKSVCRSLQKNTYFRKRYPKVVNSKNFTVGGDSGFFDSFSLLVEIRCQL